MYISFIQAAFILPNKFEPGDNHSELVSGSFYLT